MAEINSAASAPIKDNGHVKELLALMEANNMPGAKDLQTVISQVAAMENNLAAMVKEVAAMRRELAEAQHMAHPIRNAMQKAVIAMQSQVIELRDKLSGIKKHIISGCRDALAAVKETGLSALRSVAGFFKVRPGLESLRDQLDRDIRHDEAQIAKIEAMSAQYHEAGRHIKNLVLLMIGKEPIQETKPVGKLAKAMEAPAKADRACLSAIRRNVAAAIGAIDRLEKTDRKPPIMETINRLNEQIAQARRDAPSVGRPAPAHDERA